MSEREEKFERMMQAVLDSYNSVVEKMDTLIMPKDIPHAVYGEEQFKMQLVVSY